MQKNRLVPRKWIRILIYKRRMPTISGPKIKVSLPFDEAYVSVWPAVFLLYPHIAGTSLWSKDEDRALFESMTQAYCTCPETLCTHPGMLFLGELSRYNVIRFEGMADEERIDMLRSLLHHTFGNPSLELEGRDFLSRNPGISIGDQELGDLQTFSREPRKALDQRSTSGLTGEASSS